MCIHQHKSIRTVQNKFNLIRVKIEECGTFFAENIKIVNLAFYR